MVSLVAPGSMLPPPRPTLGKRDSSHFDADTDHTYTAKKPKVAFDDHVDVRIMDDWTDKSYDLVKEEVRIAIHRHLVPPPQQDDAHYARLLQTLGQDVRSADAPSSKLLRKYLMALNARMPVLGECGKLVSAVLDLSWLGRDGEFVEIYTKFIVVLASTHGKYNTIVMDRLVSHFERLPASTGRLPDEDPVTRAAMFERIHDLIHVLTVRIPSAGGVLLRVLKNQFPNDMATTKGHLQYQKHLLQIADEVPHLRSEILALIMQNLVNIDVQIQTDIDELEDDEEERLLQLPGARDDTTGGDDSDDSDLDSLSESEMTTTEEEQRLRELRLKVAKMDVTQDLLFEHYAASFHADCTPEDNEAYREMLNHFSMFIMPNRSRHAQFLLFHFAQASPAYANHFVQFCLRATLDRNASIPSRLTACAYVASFTARASHIPKASIRSVFQLLCQFLDQMRRQYEPNCAGPDRKSYSMYYAVAQALLYVFCFQWRNLVVGETSFESTGEHATEEDILAEGNDLQWLHGIKETLNSNVISILNPLKVCSAAIVTEFAKISNHLRFLYVFSLLERNKRIRLGQATSFYRLGNTIDIGRRETAWDRKVGDAHHQLEAYFPFDPYHLPRSKRWLEGEYNVWKLPRGMKADDDEDEDSETEDESDEDEDEDEDIPEDLTHETLADHISISS